MTSGAGLACLVTVVEDPPNEREREERDHTKIEKKRSNNSYVAVVDSTIERMMV
jgi:hypothetical protein